MVGAYNIAPNLNSVYDHDDNDKIVVYDKILPCLTDDFIIIIIVAVTVSQHNSVAIMRPKTKTIIIAFVDFRVSSKYHKFVSLLRVQLRNSNNNHNS